MPRPEACLSRLALQDEGMLREERDRSLDEAVVVPQDESDFASPRHLSLSLRASDTTLRHFHSSIVWSARTSQACSLDKSCWSLAISTRVFCIRGQKSTQSEKQNNRPLLVLPIVHNTHAFKLVLQRCLSWVTDVCGICMSALLFRMHAVMIAQSCRQAHTASVGIVSMSVGTCCAPLGAMRYCQAKHAHSARSKPVCIAPLSCHQIIIVCLLAF